MTASHVLLRMALAVMLLAAGAPVAFGWPGLSHIIITKEADYPELKFYANLPDPIKGRAVLEAPPLAKAPGLGDLTAVGLYLHGAFDVRVLSARVDVPASEIRSTMEAQKRFVARMMWIMQEQMKWAQEQQGGSVPPSGPPANP